MYYVIRIWPDHGANLQYSTEDSLEGIHRHLEKTISTRDGVE